MGNNLSIKHTKLQQSIDNELIHIKRNTECFTDNYNEYNKLCTTENIVINRDVEQYYYDLIQAIMNLDTNKIHNILEKHIFDFTICIDNMKLVWKDIHLKEIMVISKKNIKKEELQFLQKMRQELDTYSMWLSYHTLIYYKLTKEIIKPNNNKHYCDINVSFSKMLKRNITLIDCIIEYFKETGNKDYKTIYLCVNMISDNNSNSINNNLFDSIFGCIDNYNELIKIIQIFVKNDCKLNMNNITLKDLLKKHKKSKRADDIINIIVTKMINSTLQTSDGTWLHYIIKACGNFCDDYIEQLIDYIIQTGCDINYLNSNNKNILNILIKRGNYRLLEYLLEKYDFTDHIFRNAYHQSQFKNSNKHIKYIFNHINKIRKIKKIKNLLSSDVNIKNIIKIIENDNEICAICLHKKIGNLVLIPCGHKRFCDNCVGIIKSKKITCPLCKK